jgi:hypothetical protein
MRRALLGLAGLLLAGCGVFGPPTVSLPRAEVERAHVYLAYTFGKVEQWAVQKCAAKELTSADCKQAQAVAERMKALHQTATERLAANPQQFDAALWLRIIETLLPLALATL